MTLKWNLVMDCLLIMVQGMVGIFVVILVIWALVALLKPLHRREEAQGGQEGAVTPPPQEEMSPRRLWTPGAFCVMLSRCGYW